MSLRIKVCHEDDIRMFKSKTTNENELLTKLKEFVKESYHVDKFRLSFKDSEGDEITIVDEDDLHEAIQSSKQTTKIYVKTPTTKTQTIQKDEVEEQESEDEQEIGETYTTNNNNDNVGSSSDEEEEVNDNFRSKCEEYLKFLDDLGDDKELKQEFISFLTTFISSLQNNKINNNGSELFIQALSMYNKLNKHKVMDKFVTEKLDILFYQFPHLLNILTTINVSEINKFIDLIIDFHNNNKNSPRSNHFPMLPPFLFPFLRLFSSKNQNEGETIPPFGLGPSLFNIFAPRGGFHGRRGRHCGFRGRHRNNSNNNDNNEDEHKHKHHGHGHGHGRKHHGHHGFGRGFCRRGGNRHGMRKSCGRGFFNHPFFGNMNMNMHNIHNMSNTHCGKYKKNKELRADIIDENITLGKNAIVASNRTLIKTWKMKNVGKKIIPKDISIQYFGRKFNPMIDGHKFDLNNKEININEEFEVSVVVKSPIENGKYSSKWKLVTKDGKKFGQALHVQFIVNDEKKLTKEEKRILKNEKKSFKKEKKILKKEEKINRRKEKIRNKREKLLKQLEQLETQQIALSNINNNSNNDKDDDEKELTDEQDITVTDNINVNVNNNSNNNHDDDDIVIVDDNEDDITTKLTEEGTVFEYQQQLDQLYNMGFGGSNLKQLLVNNNGNLEQVLNIIM